MKTSTRHRWIMLIGAGPPSSNIRICRDCGLEIAPDHIKGGGLGECAGKACERQDRLPLISGDPQNVCGNLMPTIACVGCGLAAESILIHRNPASRMTGLLYTCLRCGSYLKDHAIVFVPKEEREQGGSITDGEEGSAEGTGRRRDDSPGGPEDSEAAGEGRGAAA